MSAVVSPSYLLSATYPLNHARIGYQSWAASLSASAVSASSTASGFPKDAPLRPDTYEVWKSTASGWWRVDLGQARSVDYVGILGELAGVTVTVEYSSNDFDWTTFSVAEAPDSNAPLMFLDSEVTARYWRVSLASAGALASVYIGQVLEMQRPFFGGHTPIPLSRTTEVRASMSRSGQFLAQDIVKTGYQGSMAWKNLMIDWYRENFEPLVLHLRTRPAFFIWNLDKYAGDTVYGWVTDDVSPSQLAQGRGGRMEVMMKITGVGYGE